jgi:CheY-like chemotaxis protein
VFQADTGTVIPGIGLDTYCGQRSDKRFSKRDLRLIQSKRELSDICPRGCAKAPGMKTTSGMRPASAPKLVVVIDDDPLVLEATGSLLRSWGFQVVTAESDAQAMAGLAKYGRRPDLIVCDYRLSEGARGVEVIERLRSAFEIPALLISGDGSLPQADATTGPYHLLHKPVDAETFRTALRDASVLQPRE